MELRHLRHFVAVADELHFARAAERLGMEQSPLSQSIRNLEAHLGTKLFQRTTRRTWLTCAGSRFYQEARRILADIDAAVAVARRETDEQPNLVRLVLGDDLATEPFTRLLFQLAHHQPKVRLDVRELAGVEAARLVRDRGSDIVVTYSPKDEPELKRSCGWSEPLMATVPIGHPLAVQGRVSLGALSNEVLALPSSGHCLGYIAQINELLHHHDVRPADRRDVRHWNTAVSLVATGQALALCPFTMVHTATAVAIVPIEEEDARLATWLLYRDDEPSSAVALVLGIAASIACEPASESGLRA